MSTEFEKSIEVSLHLFFFDSIIQSNPPRITNGVPRSMGHVCALSKFDLNLIERTYYKECRPNKGNYKKITTDVTIFF